MKNLNFLGYLFSFFLMIMSSKTLASPEVIDKIDAKEIFQKIESRYTSCPSCFIYISLSNHKLYFFSEKMLEKFFDTMKETKSLFGEKDLRYISFKEEEQSFDEKNKILFCYPISKSKNPCSCEIGSEGTPLGKHKVVKIITGKHPFSRFISRIEVGDSIIYRKLGDDRGMIIGGILVLSGCETACESTEKRYIYIHGSLREQDIGKVDFSNGCILMQPADIYHLCHYVEPETIVLIDE